MRELQADFRHGCRLMIRAPGFALLAVLILGTGIGAATAMFSLVHAALLRALPFDDPDRVVWMYTSERNGTARRCRSPTWRITGGNRRRSPAWRCSRTGPPI